VFSILNKTSVLEDSCFYSSLPAEAVAIAMFKYASIHSNVSSTVDAALQSEKLNLLNKLFLSEQCAV